jgi:AcrR family transcriptional regulator
VHLVNKPKTARGEETLQRICSAAEELFADRGYYNTQIGDIARKAGVATGTFYIYFPDKISVFRYLLNELGHQLRREIRAAAAGTENQQEAEYVGLRTFLSFASKHIGLFKIIWQAQFVDMEAFKEYYETFSARYICHISDAQDRGEFADIDPVYFSYILMGIYNFVALKCIVFDEKEPSEELVQEVFKFIRNGAFAPPGEKKNSSLQAAEEPVERDRKPKGKRKEGNVRSGTRPGR